ncbi:hypothetical protein [Mucilaginibacter puniceus]
MKKLNVLFFVAAITALSGCSVIGDIFKAGAYFGIFAVVFFVILIVWLISKFRGK